MGGSSEIALPQAAPKCVAAWLREATPLAQDASTATATTLGRQTPTVPAGNPPAFRYAVSDRVGNIGRAGIRCRQQPIAVDRQTRESPHLTPAD